VKKRSAFTMIELVMVIVILGIVASIGAEIIASLYSNYLRIRTINRLEAQTEITLEQIAKRLQYRIKDSTIARKTGNYLALSSSSVDDTYSVLEWIGYSNESLLASPPGWSGFIDLNSSGTSSTAKTLSSPESNLTFASNTIDALTYDALDLTAGKEAALIFKVSYDAADFGWGATANSEGTATIKVYENNSTSFKITSSTLPSEIYEQYYLAHTAYAITPSNTSSTDFNLTLYYNYQPWLNQFYTAGTSQVLAEHVSLFRFRQDQSIIHLKLCLHDANQTGLDNYVVVCKEKVVY